MRSEFGTAYELAEDFIATAEKRGDDNDLLIAYRIMGSCLTFLGRWEESIQYLEKSLSLYDIERHKSLAVTYAQDPRIAALTLYSWSLLHNGRYDDALRAAKMAIDEAHAFGHLHTTAYALGLAGTMFYQFCGMLKRTRECADTLVEMCTKQPVPLWNNLGFCLQGWAIGMQGDPASGIRQLEKGYDGFSGTGATMFMDYYCTLKAELYIEDDKPDHAIECLEQAQAAQKKKEVDWFAAGFHRACGDLYCKMGMDEKAVSAYNAGLEIATTRNDLLNQLRCSMGIVELNRDTAQAINGLVVLKTIYQRFPQGHESPDLIRAAGILNSN